jgi:hypothetical protein
MRISSAYKRANNRKDRLEWIRVLIVELRVADNYVHILFLRPNNVLSNSLLIHQTIDYFLLFFYLYFLSRLFILLGYDVVGNVCCGIDGGQ